MKEKNMVYNLTCNTDDNYVQHCCVMLCSLFENNKEIVFHIYVLAHNLSSCSSEILKKLVQRYHHEITIYDVDELRLEGVVFRKNRPLTKAAYYRVLLPEILDTSIEKILYLDCDIVVVGEVCEIYEIDLTDYPLAACEDASPYTALHRRQLNLSLNDRTFCSGVMMINLKFWRENDAMAELLAYSKKPREMVYLHDQDSLNFVFRGNWFKLPYKWNKTPQSIVPLDNDQRLFDISDYRHQPVIIHYASALKPWYDVWFPEKKEYIKYLILSEYPNPKVIHLESAKRMSCYLHVVRYCANKYLRPLLPRIFEIILLDIVNTIKLLCTAILRPTKFGDTLFRIWLSRYR